MSDEKFCVNCKYFKRAFPYFGKTSERFATCRSPQQGTDLVGQRPITGFVTIAREFRHLCGFDAKWFEPK